MNFVLAAPGADRIELLLYSNGNDRSPERVIELDGRRHRSGDYWHVEVEGSAKAAVTATGSSGR